MIVMFVDIIKVLCNNDKSTIYSRALNSIVEGFSAENLLPARSFLLSTVFSLYQLSAFRGLFSVFSSLFSDIIVHSDIFLTFISRKDNHIAIGWLITETED
jgi:hypothetical protein